jgi:hypothetical protein
VTTPSGKPPPVTWKAISRVADDANAADAADVDALSCMSDAAIDAELAAAGFSPDDAGKLVGDALATPAVPAKPSGPVLVSGSVEKARRPPRPSRWPAFALAAAAILLGLLFWKRAEVVAFFSPGPEPIGPDREGPPRGPSPVQLAQARQLRVEALGDCADHFWPECTDKLDRAKALDPAGDTAPDVQTARAAIAAAKSAPSVPSGGKLKP